MADDDKCSEDNNLRKTQESKFNLLSMAKNGLKTHKGRMFCLCVMSLLHEQSRVSERLRVTSLLC